MVVWNYQIYSFVKGNGKASGKIVKFRLLLHRAGKGSIGRGTFLWTAPACLNEADEEPREFMDTITRDLYGFGLTIW